MGWFLYDNGIRHERVKALFLSIKLLTFFNLKSYILVKIVALRKGLLYKFLNNS